MPEKPVTDERRSVYADTARGYAGDLQPWLAQPDRVNWLPGEYESVVATQQRRALRSSHAARVLDACSPQINEMMHDGRWKKIRDNVAGGQPSLDELQLLLFAATGDELHFRKRSAPVRFIRNRGLPGSDFLDLLPSSVADLQDRRALRDYVHASHKAWYIQEQGGGTPYETFTKKVRFNENSPHVPLIAYLDYVRLGSWLPLDVTQADTQRDALIQRISAQLDAVRGSGEYQLLPQYTWWQAHALRTFVEDRSAYASGRTALASMYGRQWQYVGRTGETGREFTKYLDERRGLVSASNNLYRELSELPVQPLKHQLLQSVQAGSSELAGIAWAVLSERRFLNLEGTAAVDVLRQAASSVKPLLEPYILEGLDMVADRTAPRWLQVAVLDSYLYEKPYTTLFTTAYGSIDSDRSAAGKALAMAFAQKYDHTKGYGSFRSETALAAAYQLRETSPDMLGKEIATRRMAGLTHLYRHFRKREDRRLPQTVRAAYEALL